MRRTNPLLFDTHLLDIQHRHRAGSRFSEELAEWAGLVDHDELYRGVHVGPHPSTAATYALNRLRMTEYGSVSHAPVLVGISTEGLQVGVHDADLLTAAQHLGEAHREILEALEDVLDDTGSLDEAWEALEEDDVISDVLSEYSASEWLDPDEFGVTSMFGDLSVRGHRDDWRDELFRLVEEYPDSEPDQGELIEAAARIVPQRRIDEDVPAERVVALAFVPPYSPGEESERHEAGAPYADDSAYREDGTLSDHDDVLESEWVVLWGNPADADQWHGTDSTAVADALPELGFSEWELLEAYADAFGLIVE